MGGKEWRALAKADGLNLSRLVSEVTAAHEAIEAKGRPEATPDLRIRATRGLAPDHPEVARADDHGPGQIFDSVRAPLPPAECPSGGATWGAGPSGVASRRGKTFPRVEEDQL